MSNMVVGLSGEVLDAAEEKVITDITGKKLHKIDKEFEEAENKAKQLPVPQGYNILCVVPESDESFDNGIIKAGYTRDVEETASLVLFVVDLGAEAYTDKSKFPNGPWCKKGDFVLVRAYSGTRFKIQGREFRLIFDDTVQAVVDDPRGISRI